MAHKTHLLFDHIPKTAGVSIVTALSQAMGEDGRLATYACPHHVAIASAGPRKFIAGHLWFAPGEHLAVNWYYATILRDPVDRFLSQYHFGRYLTPDPGHESALDDPQVAAARRHRLEEYLALEDESVRRSYRNIQAVHFAQRTRIDPYALSDAELLDAAVASMDEYDLTGTFDDLPGFIEVACRDLGLQPVSLPVLNVTPSRRGGDGVDPRLKGFLADANRVDQELVRLARERFRMAASGDASRKGAPSPAARRAQAPESNFSADSTEFGTREIEIVAASCAREGVGESITVTASCAASISEPDLTIGMAVVDPQGKTVCGTNSRLLGVSVPIAGPRPFAARFVLHGNLAPGRYTVTLALHKGLNHLEGCYHWVSNATSFVVAADVDADADAQMGMPAELHTRFSLEAAE